MAFDDIIWDSERKIVQIYVCLRSALLNVAGRDTGLRPIRVYAFPVIVVLGFKFRTISVLNTNEMWSSVLP